MLVTGTLFARSYHPSVSEKLFVLAADGGVFRVRGCPVGLGPDDWWTARVEGLGILRMSDSTGRCLPPIHTVPVED